MKRMKDVVKSLTVVLAMVSMSAVAQKEQWLEYNTSRQPRSYRLMEVSTTAPEGVALPKLNSSAYYAKWTTPLDPKGRWVAMDRTKGSGLCDRLFIDSNGNGKLDDEAPVTAAGTDQYSASFAPVKVVLKGEDGPISYHIIFRFSKYSDDRTQLLAASGGWYGGTIELGGKKRRIQLIDGNVNGVFNDVAKTPYESDRVIFPTDKQEDRDGEQFLGKMVEVDGVFYNIEVARDGAFVKLQKAENLAMGKVEVPTFINSFVAYGSNGHFSRKPDKGGFTLPAGKYQVLSWETEKKDAKGAKWKMSGYGFPDSATFEVGEKPLTLKVGEAPRATISLAPGQQSDQVRFDLAFVGNYKESIQFTKGDQRPPGPKLALMSQDGSLKWTNSFEFG